MFTKALEICNTQTDDILEDLNLVQKDEDGDELYFNNLQELFEHDEEVATKVWEHTARLETNELESLVNVEEALAGETHEGIALGDVINEMVYMSFVNGQYKQFVGQLGINIEDIEAFIGFLKDKPDGDKAIEYIATNV